MPKKLKKSRTNPKGTVVTKNSFGDVTLSDYANSAVPSGKGRLRKCYNPPVSDIERKVKNLSMNEDDRDWDEKLDDLDDINFVEDEENGGYKVLKKNSRRKKKIDDPNEDHGVVYPLDIWFLISEYIRPEDVGTFARICQSTRQVVSTAKFWFSLYKRYYVKGIKLPERLKPDCMVRHFGLRSCVIRALHFMYPPFVDRARIMSRFEADPHQLIRRQCVLFWHEKFKNQWVFCFKLRRVNHDTQRNQDKSRKMNLFELLDNVYANAEEGCKVLQVTCTNYVPTPMVLGQTLLGVSLTLDQAMRTKLQLDFGSGPRCTVEAGSSRVILNPAMKVCVLDWWHPLYPHSNTVPRLEDTS